MADKRNRTRRDNRSLIMDYAATLSSTGLISLIGVITGVLTARLLGPAGKGDLATIFWLPGLLTTAAILALPQAVAFQVSRNQESHKIMTAVGFWLGLFWGLLLAAVLYPFIPQILGNSKIYLTKISRWYLLYLPIAFSGLTLLGVDQGRQAFLRYNLLRLLPAVFFFIALVIVWLIQKVDLNTIVMSNLLAQLLATLIRGVAAGKALFTNSSHNWITTVKQLLKTGMVFHLPDLAGIVLLRMDMAMLIHMVSAKEIGFYSVATAISIGQIGVVTSVVQVGFPKLVKYKGMDALPALLKQFRLVQPMVLSTALLVALFTPWIIRYLFGPEFQPAVIPTFILIMAIALWGLKQVLDNGLRAMGYGMPGTIANGMGLVVLVLTGYTLTHSYGIIGMATGVLISQGLTCVILLIILRKKVAKYSWKNIFGFNMHSFHEIRSAFKKKA